VPTTIPLDSAKSETYYRLARADVIALLPQPVGAVLDVGCGEGGAAGSLRAAGATRIVGIELLPEPAAAAQAVYDDVLVGDAMEQVRAVRPPFDTIICYDVLEHLYDPLSLLRALREVSAEGGRLHVSVPNASHITLLRDLIFRGTFGYQPYGHRDATHLRWFTRKDIAALVGEAGWSVSATTPSKLLWRSRLLDRFTRGRSTEFLAGQWYVLATNP
jgi:2-polyprenyl-3-methyl-5-hydroxy-6-metoxy-1,4-benzoquinol methylase